jgi:colicin import membrane protein
MSERPRENSVLFSLRELRRIEDDRVKKEQDAARAKAEAERQARDAADRAAREAEDRRLREEQERVRLAKEEEEARHREGDLRVQEAERRARVEGEMRINEERMRLEMQHKKKHSPVKAVLTVAGILIVIGGGVGYKMYSQHQAELATERAERDRIEREAKKARAELEARLTNMEKDFADKLKNAKSAEDVERIKAERAQARLDIQAGRPAHPRPTQAKPDQPTGPKPPKGKREISDNPLDGLGNL